MWSTPFPDSLKMSCMAGWVWRHMPVTSTLKSPGRRMKSVGSRSYISKPCLQGGWVFGRKEERVGGRAGGKESEKDYEHRMKP